MPWLVAWLRREMTSGDEELRGLYEAAVEAALRYPRTEAGVADQDASWDEVLASIDAIVVRRQRDHLDAVRAAGVSGKDVPPAAASH